VFRAETLDAALNIFRGLATPLQFNTGRHLMPLVIVPLIAFLAPASQDIVARLTARPRVVLAGLLGIGILALLIEIGDRDVHEFVYFQF
jgi:alginate O-acetyltransferase complex protein AlgI